MSRAGDWASRLPRGAVFALTCTGLAAAAHAIAHGGPPPPAVLAGAAGGVAILTVPFTGRARGLSTVIAVMVAVQAGLHTVFSLAPFTRSGGSMRAGLESTLCLPSGAAVPDAVVQRMLRVQAPLLPRPAAMPIAPWHGNPLMLGGHLLAAVAVSVLLHCCDDAVSTAAGLATVTLTAVATVIIAFRGRMATDLGVPAGPRPRRPPENSSHHRPPACWLCHARVLRGPPRPSANTVITLG